MTESEEESKISDKEESLPVKRSLSVYSISILKFI